MRDRLRRQYYCDFCKKSGASKYYMRIHEEHCTNNPNRKCRMCILINGDNGKPIKDLIKAIGDGGDEGLERLRESAEGCPACMLAGIRQSGINDFDSDDPIRSAEKYMEFNFKKERDDAFSEIEPDYY